MKKKKKLLSLLLAFAVGVSACTTAIAAFAAPADVEAVTKAIEALEDKTDVTTQLTDQYRDDLSEEEKNSIAPSLIHKLYNLRYQASKVRPPTAVKKIPDVIKALGAFTPLMEKGMTLSGQMQGKLPVAYTNAAGEQVTDQPFNVNTPNFADANYRRQYEAYKQLWANATDYERQFADLQSYMALKDGTQFIGNDSSSPVSSKAYFEVYYAEQLYLGKNPQQLQESLKSFPGNKNYVDYINQVAVYADTYNAFIQGQKSLEEFVSAANAIDESKLPDVNLGKVKPFAILQEDGTYKSVSAGELFLAMRNEVSISGPMREFCEFIKSVTLPAEPSEAFNATVAKARKDAKRLVTYNQKYNLDMVQNQYPDVYAKYESILALEYNTFITKDEIADTHVVFEEKTVKYDMARPYGDIIQKTIFPALTKLKGLAGIADGLLFTNANVKPVVTLLGNISLVASDVKFTPKASADALLNFSDTTDLANRIIKCLGAPITDENGDPSYENNNWDAIPADFDWGVKDGDFDSFCMAVLGGLLGSQIGMVIMLAQVGMPNMSEYDSDGNMSSFTLGIYERVVVPLLEALGAENVMDSTTYTKNCPSNEGDGTFATGFKPIMMVLEQVYGVYRQILNDPMGYITTNVPNLIYHLEDGCIFGAISNLLDSLGGLLGDVSAIKQYLSLDAIFALLTPTLEQAGIKLDFNDIKAFASLGEAKVVPSVSLTHKNTIYVAGNADSVLAQLAKIVEPIALDLLDSKLGFSFDPIKDFVKVEAPKYPHDGKMGKDVMLAMIDGLDALLGGIVDINGLINNNLCTPEMAATAITGIYTALANINIAGIAIPELATPKIVASMLTEDKYKDIRAALQVESWNNVALVLKNGDTIAYQCDMGFKAGDRQGFVDCLTASLRPLVAALADAGLLVNTIGEDGTTTGYGLYETVIIPLFEALGVKPATDSVNYTSNYNKLALKADKGEAYDYLLKTVLSPVLDLLNQLAASPASTLMGLLPNLAYAVQYSEDLAFVGNLLAGEDGNIDLAGMVNGLLAGILPGFELPPIPLDALASCGEVKTLDSMSQLHDSYTNVKADKADAFVTVFYYLYDAVNYKDNLNTIKGLISGIEGMDPGLKTMVDTLLNDVFTSGKEEALCMMGTLLASDLWQCPDADDENSGTGTPSAGDASIAAAAVLPVMLAAAGAIFFLRKKKETV